MIFNNNFNTCTIVNANVQFTIKVNCVLRNVIVLFVKVKVFESGGGAVF